MLGDAKTLDCARCGAWFTTRPGAERAHAMVFGHWPKAAQTMTTDGGDAMRDPPAAGPQRRT